MKTETVDLWGDGSSARYISYLFDKAENPPMVKKRPAMIICPGGGYLSTEYREGEPVAMHFLNLGYQVFVLHYHTRSTGGDTVYPSPLYDIAKLILTVRQNADEWGIDPEKVGIMGFSAGGNLCSILSTRWHSSLLREKFGVENSELFKPTCAVLCYPLTKEKTFVEGGNERPEIPEPLKPYEYLLTAMETAMSRTFFGTETPSEEQLRLLRTVDEVDKRTPPTFLWTAADDYMVDAACSIDYASALLRHRVPVELHVFEHGGHGLSKGTVDSASTPLEIDPVAAKWLELADNWLKKYLSL